MEFETFYQLPCASAQSPPQRYEETLIQIQHAEALDIVLLAWTSETFSYDGKYYQYQDVQVVPKPVQQPHPPIRIACNSSESFQIAGERGWRLFSSPVVVPIPRLQQDLSIYNALLNEHGTPRHGDEIALMAPVYVAASTAKAREYPEASITNYFRVLHRMYSTPQAMAAAELSPRMQEMQARLKAMTYDHMLENFAIFGEPGHCIDRIHWLRETFGIRQFICWFNTGGLIPHQRVMESMTLFAERVMPYVE